MNTVLLQSCQWPLGCTRAAQQIGTQDPLLPGDMRHVIVSGRRHYAMVWACERHPLVLRPRVIAAFRCSHFGCHARAMHALCWRDGRYDILRGCEQHPFRLVGLVPVELQ